MISRGGARWSWWPIVGGKLPTIACAHSHPARLAPLAPLRPLLVSVQLTTRTPLQCLATRPSTSIHPPIYEEALRKRAQEEGAEGDSAPDPSVVTKDVVRLAIRAGRGGRGIPRYNGLGGFGASVYLRPVPGLSFNRFFNNYQQEDANKVRAPDGENSSQVKLMGKNAEEMVLDVPMGVECVDMEERLLARCNSPKKRYLIARGGMGGCPQNSFRGEPGEQLTVDVHLKLRPNVGILGFPNAGKSTLLKALVPEKKVKIASYPFTTLEPQVCYLKYANVVEEEENGEANKRRDREWTRYYPPFTLSIADLPGVIEGAHMNLGMGCKFLRHLEDSDIIAMVVDVHGFQYKPRLEDPYRTALETIGLLNKEAELYGRGLLKKPYVLLLNKIDHADGEKKALELKQLLTPLPNEDDTPELREKEKPGRKWKGGGRWAKELNEECRPKIPIHFEAVLAISAKHRELDNLQHVLRDIHNRIHPLEHFKFEEERLLLEGKKKVLV